MCTTHGIHIFNENLPWIDLNGRICGNLAPNLKLPRDSARTVVEMSQSPVCCQIVHLFPHSIETFHVSMAPNSAPVGYSNALQENTTH